MLNIIQHIIEKKIDRNKLSLLPLLKGVRGFQVHPFFLKRKSRRTQRKLK